MFFFQLSRTPHDSFPLGYVRIVPIFPFLAAFSFLGGSIFLAICDDGLLSFRVHCWNYGSITGVQQCPIFASLLFAWQACQ